MKVPYTRAIKTALAGKFSTALGHEDKNCLEPEFWLELKTRFLISPAYTFFMIGIFLARNVEKLL